MSQITITPGQLANAIDGESKFIQSAARKAAVRACHRLRAHLMKETKKQGIDDQGIYRAGFQVVETSKTVSVVNAAPHAGLVEHGSRPHAVNRAGIQAIAGWVRRKLGVKNPKQALSIAFAIAHKIKISGQKPRWVMLNSVPVARAFFKQEFEKLLKEKKSK